VNRECEFKNTGAVGFDVNLKLVVIILTCDFWSGGWAHYGLSCGRSWLHSNR